METTMMLVPKKSAAETFEVRRCDQELEDWLANLPSEIQYSPAASMQLNEAEEVLHSHRALLKMVYLTTSSALHRPQVLPSIPFPSMDAELQEMSRNKVRYAAVEITNIANDLHSLDLTRYFPTTGVTVLLPAVIIHLLDIKSSDPNVRMTSLQRFYQCMRILQRLREIYASADFATSFLEAAIRKAGIQLTVAPQDVQQTQPTMNTTADTTTSPSHMPDPNTRLSTLTPPPDSLAQKLPGLTYPKTAEPAPLGASAEEGGPLFVSTPPPSDGSENGSMKNIMPNYQSSDAFRIPNVESELSLSQLMDLANDAEVTQNDFDALINFDDAGADFFAADNNNNNNNNGSGNKNANNTSNDTTNNASDPKGFDFVNPMPDMMDFDPTEPTKVEFTGLNDGPIPESASTEATRPEVKGITTDLDADLGLFS